MDIGMQEGSFGNPESSERESRWTVPNFSSKYETIRKPQSLAMLNASKT
jgi:hypothetical protein